MRYLLVVLFVIALPLFAVLALETDYLEPLGVDEWLPDEPFVKAELRRTVTSEDISGRIDQALAEDRYDDAVMYQEIADYAGIGLPQETLNSLAEAQSLAASITRNTGSFFTGFITGEAEDSAGFAGAITSDLTVVGDIRDIGIEGGKLVTGEDYSQIVLGLSVVGLAATTATVATGGTALPARVGVSLLKVAKKAGTMTARFTKQLGNLVSRAVNFPALRQSLRSVDLADSAATRRAISDYASKVDVAPLRPVFGQMNDLRQNAGAIESVRLMRYVENTDDLARVSRLSKVAGTKTRGIVELTGKTSLRAFKGLFNLFAWLLEWIWAGIVAIFGYFATRGANRLRKRVTQRRQAA